MKGVLRFWGIGRIWDFVAGRIESTYTAPWTVIAGLCEADRYREVCIAHANFRTARDPLESSAPAG
ncbi:MAG TPA: hypothetical protein VES20_03435 [Bryobacteraceae bacterium]|nr:hypothetical protein [Bryobacteraceae bacterium]